MRIIGQCEHGTKSTGGQESHITQTTLCVSLASVNMAQRVLVVKNGHYTDDIMRIIGQCEHGKMSTGGQENITQTALCVSLASVNMAQRHYTDDSTGGQESHITQTTLCVSLASVNMAQRALVVKKTLHRPHYAYHWPV